MNYKKCVKMHFLVVFPDITRIANFWSTNAGTSRTKGVCQTVYTFIRSSLGDV